MQRGRDNEPRRAQTVQERHSSGMPQEMSTASSRFQAWPSVAATFARQFLYSMQTNFRPKRTKRGRSGTVRLAGMKPLGPEQSARPITDHWLYRDLQLKIYQSKREADRACLPFPLTPAPSGDLQNRLEQLPVSGSVKSAFAIVMNYRSIHIQPRPSGVASAKLCRSTYGGIDGDDCPTLD